MIQAINIFWLMYTDDMVIISETSEGLQNMLDSLSKYTGKWDLTVNNNKTKVVAEFSDTMHMVAFVKTNFEHVITVVDEFNYLGILLNCNGNFRKLQKRTADQCKKALFCLNENILILKPYWRFLYVCK